MVLVRVTTKTWQIEATTASSAANIQSLTLKERLDRMENEPCQSDCSGSIAATNDMPALATLSSSSSNPISAKRGTSFCIVMLRSMPTGGLKPLARVMYRSFVCSVSILGISVLYAQPRWVRGPSHSRVISYQDIWLCVSIVNTQARCGRHACRPQCAWPCLGNPDPGLFRQPQLLGRILEWNGFARGQAISILCIALCFATDDVYVRRPRRRRPRRRRP